MDDRLDRYLGKLRLQGQLEDRDLVFTLNPQAARRKLESFLAPAPGSCALFLVASAVASGASLLSVETGRRLVRFEHDGAPLTPSELENLLSSLFVSTTRKELPELALGLFCALQEGAELATVTSGAQRLELSFEGQTLGVAPERPGLVAGLTGLDPGPCLRALEQRCAAAPIPIRVNGRLLNPAVDLGPCLVVSRSRNLPIPCRFSAGCELEHAGVSSLLALDAAGRPATVEAVLRGVSYELPPLHEELPLRAVIWDPPLRLDLSRQGVVDDAERAELLRWLSDQLETMSDALLAGYPRLRGSDRNRALAVLQRLARFRRHRGRCREAAAIYRELLAQGEAGQAASLGGLCLMLGEHEEAERALRGTALEPLTWASRGLLDQAASGLEQVERRQKALFDAAGERWRLVDTLLARSRVALLRGRVAEAERSCKRAMARALESPGAVSPQTVAVLTALVEVYQAQNRSAEALPLAFEARDESRKMFGVRSLETAAALCSLAAVCLDENLAEPARAAAEEAEAIYAEHFEPGHPEPSGCLLLQGLARGGTLELLERALELRVDAFGRCHRATAVPLFETARAHQRAGNHERTLELVSSALAFENGRLRARLLDVRACSTMATGGDLEQALGDFAEAWPLMLSAEPEPEHPLAFNWWHPDDPVAYRLPLCWWRPLGREHLEAASLAAHRARLHRLRQEPGPAQEWAGRARSYRKTTATLRLSDKGRFRGLNTRNLVELILEVEAPGRVLRAVGLQSSLGAQASSDAGADSLLLVLRSGQPLNRPGEAFEHPLGQASERLSLCVHEPPPFQVGAVPFVVDLHFVEGPSLRLPVRV